MSPSPQRPFVCISLKRHSSRVAALLVFASLSSLVAVASAQVFPGPSLPAAAWSERLATDLAAVDAASESDIGVYVSELDGGTAVGYRADKPWYIASMVKVPVAIAVLRGIEAGTFTLDTTLRLRASDYVDGGGSTNSHPLATALPIRYLMEQMIIHSDNTASDMLIDLVGVAKVNAVVTSLVPQGFGRITSLAEVRRQVYGQLTPEARHLTGADLIALHRLRTDRERLELLSTLVNAPVSSFRRRSLESAYTAYYASGLNTARLDAYGQMLSLLVQGQALGPESTDYLLALMDRTATGQHRIKAGLAPGTRFAHKTGTQRRLACDAGLLQVSEAGQTRRAIVVACARGERSLPHSESALQSVGNAICRSGLLSQHSPASQGVTDAPSCEISPRVERQRAASGTAGDIPGSLR